MAYTLYYTANFFNEREEDVQISFFKKDGDPVDVIDIPIDAEIDVVTVDNGEDEEKTNWIAIRQIQIGLFLDESSTLTWESFLTSEYDEMFVQVEVDGEKYFEGYILPDQGEAEFLPKPISLTIKATNGLALLKNIPLADVNGDEFAGDNTLISYIAGALKATGLELPIRTRCTFQYASALNRGDGPENDMFGLTY